jgi:predicted nucleic acid-binding protein
MAETDSWPLVVCDAGPLIHLDEVGCLDLLADFKAILVPEQVRDEVVRHRPALMESAAVDLRVVPVTVTAEPQFRALVKAFSLASGEQAALSLLWFHPEAVLLTDDAAARLAAKALGFRTHGSLGVLLRAIRVGRRTRIAVLTILRELPSRSTLHVKAAFLQEVIEQVESLSES